MQDMVQMHGHLVGHEVPNGAHEQIAQGRVLLEKLQQFPGVQRQYLYISHSSGRGIAELGAHQNTDVYNGAFERQVDHVLVVFVLSRDRHCALYQDESIVAGIRTVTGYVALIECLESAGGS
jgi:hypothetical protein